MDIDTTDLAQLIAGDVRSTTRIKELEAQLAVEKKKVADLEKPAAFGWQCYQDRCENAYVEQSVVRKMEAQLAAEKFTSEQLQKTIDSMAAAEAKHAAEMSRCLKGMDEANEKLRERLTSRNAQLKAAREAGMALLDALEYCHHCGGQLALDEPLVSHCESCPYDCDDHDEPECTPIYVLHDRLRKALAALDGKKEGDNDERN